MNRIRSAGNTRFAKRVVAVLAWVTVLLAGQAQTTSLEDVKPYLRAVKGTNGTSSLEVALRRLAPERGAGSEVWLVAVTHLGTREYYRELQGFLDNRALVLFEAVQADEAGLPGRDGGYSLQGDLAKALGLTFQLDEIDYDRPHFRNSDLDLQQLARMLGGTTNQVEEPGIAGQPGEGAVEFGALMQAMTGEGLMGGLARMGVAMLGASSRLQAATKIAMIEVLSQLPNDLSEIAGLPPGMQRLLRVLVEERNEAVVRDVRNALALRPAPASVGIFYGAGHMADLEFRLCRQLGYRPVEDRWMKAFGVNPRELGISDFEIAVTTRLVRAQLKGLERQKPAGGAADEGAAAPRPTPP